MEACVYMHKVQFKKLEGMGAGEKKTKFGAADLPP